MERSRISQEIANTIPTIFVERDKNIRPISYISLFQYSTKWEKFCIAFGIILAIIGGCFPAVVNVLYGEFSNMLVDRQYPATTFSTPTFILPWFGGGKTLRNVSDIEYRDALLDDAAAWAFGCTCFTFLQLVTCMFSVFLLNIVAERQISRIKILFFKSLLCKDMTWYDTKLEGNFAGKASDHMNQLEAGIGGVIGIFTYLMVIFALGIVVSLCYGWELTLAILSTLPITFGTSSVVAKFLTKLTVKEMAARTRAGQVAEEAFASIRTVVAFEGENKEIQRYTKNLEESRHTGIQVGIVSGLSSGVMWFIIYLSYAVAFAYGMRLIVASREKGDNDYTPAALLIIFFGILSGLTNLGYAYSHLRTFSVARAAAASVFDVINKDAEINPCCEEGVILPDCKGEIEFRNVHFEYPSRPASKVLRGVNLKIKAGEVVAIVGSSGSGKSTILQLIQRMYDPSQGEIFLDGENIQYLNVSWLRHQLGVVGQEPLLFGTSIRDNILYGTDSASDESVIRAATEANAHDFIMKLNDDYDTVIGQKGSTLSGGQKQRIAIARALIRNPKILLLDEATSALDSANERIVQAALDRAAQGRTTLIVTHKLSTVTNVNRIIVLQNGVVVEQGTNHELMELNGVYRNLLESQFENVRGRRRTTVEITPNQHVVEDNSILPLEVQSSFSLFNLSNLIDWPKRVSFFEILQWSRQEWTTLIIGAFAAIIGGAALPIVCVLFGDIFGLLGIHDSSVMIQQTDIFSMVLVFVGVAAGVCGFLQSYCFTTAGVRLTARLKIKAFDRMIHQDIGWFDEERNKVGALCMRLSQDTIGVQGAVGIRLGVILQAASTMSVGVLLSFFFHWKITLVTLATIPFVFTGVYLESIFVRGSSVRANTAMENSSKIAVEVISNIRAVASLSKEAFFIEKYSRAVKEGMRNMMKRAWFRGFAFAVGQTSPFFGYGLSLWYGGMLVAEENVHYKYVIMVSEILIFGAWTLGQCVVLVPSFSEARAAAGRLKYIFIRTPHITDGHITTPPTIGHDAIIQYSKVFFSYPTRPSVEILKNFSITIKGGEYIGIMGPSGSGKSTLIQLLQRLYDPNLGNISINNANISDYKLSALRKSLGLVSQEPVLFDRTVYENIAYGDNSREVSINEVKEAAKAANIHSFIESLPLGYDTKLGAAGAQLSGGQKQRIAIARALVRNPQILLLDEATSALDPQSENIVQDTLDKVSSGRTTITIAHRLGAVRNADIIYVLEKGAVKEWGTHEQLMRSQGLYYAMRQSEDHQNN